jgi:hypothetical protein
MKWQDSCEQERKTKRAQQIGRTESAEYSEEAERKITDASCRSNLKEESTR